MGDWTKGIIKSSTVGTVLFSVCFLLLLKCHQFILIF